MNTQTYHPCEGCGTQVHGQGELCGPCSGMRVMSYAHAMRVLRAEARKIRASSKSAAPMEESAALFSSAQKVDEVADFIRDAVFVDAAPGEPTPRPAPVAITCARRTRVMDRASTALLVFAFGCLFGIPFRVQDGSLDPVGGLLLILAVMLIGLAVVITVAAPASKEVH